MLERAERAKVEEKVHAQIRNVLAEAWPSAGGQISDPGVRTKRPSFGARVSDPGEVPRLKARGEAQNPDEPRKANMAELARAPRGHQRSGSRPRRPSADVAKDPARGRGGASFGRCIQ